MNTLVSRGFVLSFAVLTLSLFILIFSQVQSGQLFNLRLHESEVKLHTLPLRFALDARADLNQLLGERVNVDQNATSARTTISASLPSPFSISSVLTRYQTNLTALGRDANLLVFLDLNSTLNAAEVTGRLNNGLYFQRLFDGTEATFIPTSSSFTPRAYDINVSASLPYTSTTPWSLSGSGDLYINLRYEDANTGHTFTGSGWITAAGAVNTYTWNFSGGASYFTVRVGNANGNPGTLYLDTNSPSTLGITYSVGILQDANGSTPTLAGYDLPLSAIGTDGNFIAPTTQWLTN